MEEVEAGQGREGWPRAAVNPTPNRLHEAAVLALALAALDLALADLGVASLDPNAIGPLTRLDLGIACPEELAARSTEQEVRWHMAQMLPCLELSSREKQRVIASLFDYLDDESRIVTTCAMTALAALPSGDADLHARLIPTLKRLIRTGSPAM